MSNVREYCFHDSGRETTFLVLREEPTGKGIEARLASIEIHSMPPKDVENVLSYSRLNEVLSQYKNKKNILKEISETKKFSGTVVIGD